ncbi:polyphosphate kinase 1 [Salinibacter sp. 10B]|uniref:polyphosphate kinase 1 n=1 Tax=Salinibacter sp. 10B TaxID=1923971 RepID=UPI00215772F4|nr:polyphosphate kinase 1 [Salinibacter sp. 10B]
MSSNSDSAPAADGTPSNPAPIPSPSESTASAGATFPPSVEQRDVPPRAALDHPHLYFNRELSTLDFNWRVLHQALDDRTPLLERVFFVAITAGNLDEFFRKRVGGLMRQAAAGVTKPSPDGRTPKEQLRLIRDAVVPLYDRLTSFWGETLVPRLHEKAGIHILDYDALSPSQQAVADEYFQENIFPVLTPLAVDPGHPFPFLSNLSLSLAVTLHNPRRDKDQFARVKVPSNRNRWVPLSQPHHYVPLEQVIAHNLADLFRGMEITGAYAFRVTRNADMRREEEEADDLLKMISEELRERRFAPVVRLEVEPGMPTDVRQLLTDELSIAARDVYETKSLLGHVDCMPLSDLDVPEHKYTPWEPIVPPRLRREGDPTALIRKGKTADYPNIFAAIRESDILVHHPYDSFQESVQRFVEEAADDPQVLAIKQTLYRTSENSPIVAALVDAAEQGKQVAVLVEVKARFDEANNIEWGRMLEESGVHVAYGLVGLKTHAKVTLVIRQEDGEPRTYCHIGTGNYNPKTARQYTDVGLFTRNEDVGYDITNLFHYLTGYAPEQHYRELLVAPQNMRRRFEELIQREIDHATAGREGRIIAKMNQLNDEGMIQHLYRASQAGVQIDLIVRGHCLLRPRLENYSENIRVTSILGRFLEHTRIYYFGNDGEEEVYIGSADWMSRNLNDRVEAIVEVKAPQHKERLLDLLDAALTDRRSAWDLKASGRYVQRVPTTPDEAMGFQEQLMAHAQHRTL